MIRISQLSKRYGSRTAVADVSFTAGAGDNHFSDAVTADQPGGYVNSFSDPASASSNQNWLPSPSLLSTPISPPIDCTSR